MSFTEDMKNKLEELETEHAALMNEYNEVKIRLKEAEEQKVHVAALVEIFNRNKKNLTQDISINEIPLNDDIPSERILNAKEVIKDRTVNPDREYELDKKIGELIGNR